ncbi:MAG: hypothetical protein RBT33_00870 [Candidatus Dojkabacteria bacterium]|nr:hypothetical protein [Candidatus Dojkabacteria bacterium]MDX9738905.1 hypothetical protein [Candidatus Dojkabacteria bacterium]
MIIVTDKMAYPIKITNIDIIDDVIIYLRNKLLIVGQMPSLLLITGEEKLAIHKSLADNYQLRNTEDLTENPQYFGMQVIVLGNEESI